jgi:hypothetical protein
VEYAPTLPELALSADVAGLVEVVEVREGASVQGDASEDVVIELDLVLQITEVLASRGELSGDDVTVTMLLGVVLGADSVPQVVEELNSRIPVSPVLALLRQRQSGKFRVVNGWGLWAETDRAPVDAPLNRELPSSGPYADFVRSFASVGELKDGIASKLEDRGSRDGG